jgi:hypothetical protein
MKLNLMVELETDEIDRQEIVGKIEDALGNWLFDCDVLEVREIELPELWGATEVAECLGIARNNLYSAHPPSGMPKPVAKIRAGLIWLADDIREFAVGYKARRLERELKREMAL